MPQILNFQIINGPNLNMLGKREPEIYGSKTLDQIAKETEEFVKPLNVKLSWFQSNIEGEIVNKIQELLGSSCHGLIINPGAYSHTSVAILDALKILSIPIVEVHLSNTHLREDFRAVKLTAKSSTIIMEGLGQDCYSVASFALARRLKS